MYKRLRKRFGYLDWWPGETRDEIIIGAVLTQQTSWKNVESALLNLKKRRSVDLRKISRMSLKGLETLLRPSGFYHQKAKNLRSISRYIFSNYNNLDEMFDKDKNELRKELLQLDGIGMETADSIILYAAGKQIFVVDAYTRRIMGRVYGMDEKMGYDELSRQISKSIGPDLELYKDFHAQFVELGKRYCRPKPICAECPINEHCKYFKTLTSR